MLEEATLEERRAGPRYRAGSAGEVTVACASAVVKQSKIVDVSRTGLQIEVDQPLVLGSGIELRLRGVVVLGEVGNCRLNADGRYSIGISITDVTNA